MKMTMMMIMMLLLMLRVRMTDRVFFGNLNASWKFCVNISSIGWDIGDFDDDDDDDDDDDVVVVVEGENEGQSVVWKWSSWRRGTLTIGFEEQVKVWLARHGSHCPSSTVCECIIGRNWWTLLFAFHGLCCNNSITSKVSFQILQCLTQHLNFSLSSAQVRSTQTYCHTVCFEERIPSNGRGILELTAFHSSHYQLENEPFAKKNDQGSR